MTAKCVEQDIAHDHQPAWQSSRCQKRQDTAESSDLFKLEAADLIQDQEVTTRTKCLCYDLLAPLQRSRVKMERANTGAVPVAIYMCEDSAFTALQTVDLETQTTPH